MAAERIVYLKEKNSKSKYPILTLPNDLTYLPMAIGFAQQNAIQIGFEEGEIKKIELGVEEAVSNVIKHAFAPEEDAELMITCKRVPLGLEIIIKDKGMPFDPTTVPEYNPEDIKDNAPESGLGLYLMQQFMDEVSFHNLGREGKELHLTKYLHQDSVVKINDDTIDSIIESTETKTHFPPKSIPFTIRKAKPSDAIEIAKCAYDAYGYTYAYEHIYYPDRLGELIKSGKILSVVAVTKEKNKNIMAHNALMIDDPEEKLAEMGMTFTKDEYQNHGCGKKLGFLLVKEAVKKGLLGLWGTAVTTHVLSQKGIHSAGVKECGILVGYNTDACRWKHFTQQGQRVTAVLGYFDVPLTSYFRFRRQKEIYVPEHHLHTIEKIYANLNRKPKYVDSPIKALDLPKTLPTINVRAKTCNIPAKVEVKSYGSNTVRLIKTTVKKLCLDKIEVVNLYLNLTDPFTAVLTKDFEDMGFFFAGIMPGPVTGDKLVLQYLNNVLMDYDKIQLYSDFAKELLAYIKAHDPARKAIDTNN